MRKIITAMLLSLILTMLPTTVFAAEQVKTGIQDMPELGIQEIMDMQEPAFGETFEETPRVHTPYKAGKLNVEVQKNGLWHLNFIRKLARVPEVSLNLSLAEQAQKGAVLTAANGRLSHDPGRPSDMGQNFYHSGWEMAHTSNMMGAFNTHTAVIRKSVWAYMDDSDSFNIEHLGHRRWLLNPDMEYTVFGVAGEGEAFYTLQHVVNFRKGAQDNYKVIAWPPSGNVPADAFPWHSAWSLSLNPEIYRIPQASDLKITIKGGGKTWQCTASENYLHVNAEKYGKLPCIIFRPEGHMDYRGQFTVTVSGLKDVNGKTADIFYTVNFFCADAVNPDTGLPFADVSVNAWYLPYIKRAYENKMMTGMSKNVFGPELKMTRAQTAQLLYNKAGRPAVTEKQIFNDVKPSQWFYPAVAWAASEGYVGGYGNQKFGPNDPVTREQFVTILWRCAGKPDSEYPLTAFSDTEKISDYAVSAVRWAAEHEILHGKENRKMDPQGFTTRAEAAKMMTSLPTT